MKKFTMILCIVMVAVILGSCGGAGSAASVPETKPVSAAEKTAEDPAETVPHVMISAEEEPQQTAESTPAAIPAAAQEQAASQMAVQTLADPAPKNEGCTVEANGYVIKVDSAVRGKDYNGNDITIVKYLFTNNNPSGKAFWEIAKDDVSQNGRPTSNEGVVVDGEAFYTFTTPISGGQTIQVQYAYPVLDYSAPIDVTIAVYNYSSGTAISSASCSLTIE